MRARDVLIFLIILVLSNLITLWLAWEWVWTKL